MKTKLLTTRNALFSVKDHVKPPLDPVCPPSRRRLGLFFTVRPANPFLGHPLVPIVLFAHCSCLACYMHNPRVAHLQVALTHRGLHVWIAD